MPSACTPKTLATLGADLDADKSRVVAAHRPPRQWQLRPPPAARRIRRRYVPPLYGTLVIEERDRKLYASNGTMRTELEPFTEPDTARVELIPATGEVLTFTASGVKYRDEEFVRQR